MKNKTLIVMPLAHPSVAGSWQATELPGRLGLATIGMAICCSSKAVETQKLLMELSGGKPCWMTPEGSPRWIHSDRFAFSEASFAPKRDWAMHAEDLDSAKARRWMRDVESGFVSEEYLNFAKAVDAGERLGWESRLGFGGCHAWVAKSPEAAAREHLDGVVGIAKDPFAQPSSQSSARFIHQKKLEALGCYAWLSGRWMHLARESGNGNQGGPVGAPHWLPVSQLLAHSGCRLEDMGDLMREYLESGLTKEDGMDLKHALSVAGSSGFFGGDPRALALMEQSDLQDEAGLEAVRSGKTPRI